MQFSFYFSFLCLSCILAITLTASPDEEVSKETEMGRNLKAVKVVDGVLSREEETLKTWSARLTDRKSSRKETGKKISSKKTSKQQLVKNPNPKKKNKNPNSKEKGGKRGGKKVRRRQERKKKETKRRKLKKGRKLAEKDKCKSTSKRTVPGRKINGTCLVNLLTIVETYFKQVANFEKQWKRIVSKNKTSVSKSRKMDAFKKPLERLVETGGGDVNNLSCQGSTSNPGALQMENLTSILTNCSQDIEAACDESQKPTMNMTEVDKCNAMIADFKENVDGTGGCLGKTGKELCDCFSNETLLDQAAVLRKCTLAKESQAMATALKTCKGKYGSCRKYKEDIIDIVSACSKSLDGHKEKAKQLAENVENMKVAQGAVAKVTGSGGRQFFNDR